MTNNLLATTMMCANAEALAIVIKNGLTLELMQKVMRTTMAWNQQLAVAMPKKVFLGDDSPGFAILLACKVVRLALSLIHILRCRRYYRSLLHTTASQ